MSPEILRVLLPLQDRDLPWSLNLSDCFATNSISRRLPGKVSWLSCWFHPTCTNCKPNKPQQWTQPLLFDYCRSFFKCSGRWRQLAAKNLHRITITSSILCPDFGAKPSGYWKFRRARATKTTGSLLLLGHNHINL